MSEQNYAFDKFNNKYFLRINKGSEIVSTIRNFCKTYEITLATVQGIGAVNGLALGFFNTETKVYQEKIFTEPMEITSILGNITTKDNDVYIHLHANAADQYYNCFGGHLVSAMVSLTAEITIKQSHGRIERKFNDEVGLNLFDFQ